MGGSIFTLIVLVSCGCGGGGPKGDRDTAPAKYKAQCDGLRAKFKTVAGLIPPGKVAADSPRKDLNPPMYIKKNGDKNYEVIQTELLLDPEARPGSKGEAPELQYSNDVLYCLRWTGPKAQEYIGSANFLEETFKRGLAVPYLVVVRTTDYVPVVSTGDVADKGKVKIYTGGKVSMDAFVVDLAKPEVIASFPVNANVEGITVKTEREFHDQLAGRVFANIREGLGRVTNFSKE